MGGAVGTMFAISKGLAERRSTLLASMAGTGGRDFSLYAEGAAFSSKSCELRLRVNHHRCMRSRLRDTQRRRMKKASKSRRNSRQTTTMPAIAPAGSPFFPVAPVIKGEPVPVSDEGCAPSTVLGLGTLPKAVAELLGKDMVAAIATIVNITL